MKEYPPKEWALNQRWATRAIFRAQSGFYFLQECLQKIHRGGTDPAYSRSLYILLSCSTELLLEACLLFKQENSGKIEADLRKLLRVKPNHDFAKLGDAIGDALLKQMGIQNIRHDTKNDLKRYVISLTNNQEIIIEDLECVRYDFQYDKYRSVDASEAQRITQEIGELIKITKSVMAMRPK